MKIATIIARSLRLSFRSATIEDRVVPTASGSNVLDLGWPPGFRVVFKERGSGVQDGVNNSPGLFHVIFTGEQSGVSRHCVAEPALVGIHLLSAWAASPGNFHRLVQRFIICGYAVHEDGKR